MRFTLRRIMTVVAVTFVPVVPIWLYIITHPLEKLFGNTYYGATNSVTKMWDAGPAPKIDVDLYGGYISVVQSTDGRAAAVITTSAIFKNAQAGADAAVAGIVLTTDHEGDTIRIRATNPTNLHAFNLQTDVVLRVPSGANLDLLTGEGYVHNTQEADQPFPRAGQRAGQTTRLAPQDAGQIQPYRPLPLAPRRARPAGAGMNSFGRYV